MPPRSTPKCRRLALALVLGALALRAGSPHAVASPPEARWQHIRTSLLFTSDDVQKLLARPGDRKATLAYFAPLGLTKVYIEGGREGDIPAATLRGIVADLRDRGLEVSGVVVPVNDTGTLCYNDPNDMAILEGRTRLMAQAVDEIIVDDLLFTTCTCARCLEGRGADSWADYRSRLVAEQSKIHLIDVARRVHPGIRVIIKYPDWYEGHRQHGYDVARQTPQFDGVSVGIETRQRATHDQHIPIYSGYVFQQWIGGDAGTKWRSAWLDNYGMKGDPDDFVAQVWQAVLARAPEIIFWCAGELHPPNPDADVYGPLCRLMPEFDRLAGMLVGPARGIPMHLPLGSVGEYNIFGYLGMAGLPVAPSTSFPSESKAAIFTRHSLRDPQLAAGLLARVRSGREVFLTWSLLQELRQSELWRAYNVIGEGPPVASSTFRATDASGDPYPVEAPRPFTFPGIRLSTWPYVREVALVREDGDFGVLLRTPYLEGQVDVLNMPDNSYDLLRLPEPVLNAIRRVFFAQLGVRLLGPGGVALYPFGDRQFVLFNMNDGASSVALRLPQGTPAAGWRERQHGDGLRVRTVKEGDDPDATSETEVALTLRPFEVALVEGP
jgi:hypothetical protein